MDITIDNNLIIIPLKKTAFKKFCNKKIRRKVYYELSLDKFSLDCAISYSYEAS